jgi:hypothetical protein
MSNLLLQDGYMEEISEVKEAVKDSIDKPESQRAKYLVAPYMKKGADGLVEDRISAALEGEMKEKYIEILSSGTRVLLARSLYGVPRWSVEGVGQKIDPAFQENNLDHVEELIGWANEIEQNYPELWKVLTGGEKKNWEDFYKMLIPHDNGEIIVKDMPRAHEDFHKRAGYIHKRKESWAGRRLFDLNMPAEQAEEFKKLYTRWDKRHADDQLVNFGHFLDKTQASQNVVRHVVPFNTDKPFYAGTMEGINAPMKYLERMAGLPANARAELMQFAEDKFFKPWLESKEEWVVAIADETRQKIYRVMESE